MPTADRYQQLVALSKRWIEEIWCQGNILAIDEMHASKFQDHSPAGRAGNLASYITGVVELYMGFPDFTTHIEDLIVDVSRNLVAIRWSATGTHKGFCMGMLPTGRTIKFSGVDIIRFEEDKIVERWGEWDGLSILSQMRE